MNSLTQSLSTNCTYNSTYAAGEDHDYKSVIEVMEFASGETEKLVTVNTMDDGNVENREYLELYLSAGEGVHLSPHPRAEVIITDNDGMC